MNGPRFGIFSSLVALVFLVFLRVAWANTIIAAIPAPYAARIVSALGVLIVVAVAVLIEGMGND